MEDRACKMSYDCYKPPEISLPTCRSRQYTTGLSPGLLEADDARFLTAGLQTSTLNVHAGHLQFLNDNVKQLCCVF